MTTQAPTLEIGLLEPLLRDFVQHIGLEATMAIVQAHGGTRLNIPQKGANNAALVALIGSANAAILGRLYGAERPFIAKAMPALQAMRDQRIRDDLKTMSVRRVALKYGLGERRVYQLQRDAQASASTPRRPPRGLFD